MTACSPQVLLALLINDVINAVESGPLASCGTSMETAPVSQTFPSWQSGPVNNASLCSLFSPAINLFLTSSVLSGGSGKSGPGPGHTLGFSSAAWAQWTNLTVLRESRSPRAPTPSIELTVLTGYVLGEGAHAYCMGSGRAVAARLIWFAVSQDSLF